MYFSTSSSESEYEYLFNDSFGTNSYWRPSFYPTLGQPLIYYAEVKPKKHSRRYRENEKNKPNYFVKAFRWYTQEHIALKENSSSNGIESEDMQGFATWLDAKHNEYLQINPIEQNQCTLAQPPTLTAETHSNQLPTSKKFPSTMSPWKKRAKSLIVGSKNHFKFKSNQSIKVILKSKTLTRSASASSLRSNSSATSNTKTLNVTLKNVSKSLTSVIKDKEVYVIPVEILPDDIYKDNKDFDNKSKRKERKKIKQIFPKRESLQIIKSHHKEDVLCHCSFENSKRNVPSNKLENNLTNICNCEKDTEFKDQQKIPVPSATNTNTTHRKSTSSATALISDGVQTSDYSINFTNENFHNHPMFVKIIHADKFINKVI